VTISNDRVATAIAVRARIAQALRAIAALALMLIAFTAVSQPLDESTSLTAAEAYVQALIDGDVMALRGLMEGPMRKRNAHLYEGDAEQYGAFLQARYAGAAVAMGTPRPESDGYLVPVRFDYPDRGAFSFVLLLAVTESGPKVVDELPGNG